ncbi:hypothetical protein COV82_00145 [Candidatus Peregrinibacteria bacterium CG11_big_fil_rev_8_21_14_0_20_46_8]|nr:MAG: hypothetical protein COV82_00145 [Candidatus Peregrinibacteria bacterium CG11_big_fil_rev_8_21_14_0_20_46_8]
MKNTPQSHLDRLSFPRLRGYLRIAPVITALASGCAAQVKSVHELEAKPAPTAKGGPAKNPEKLLTEELNSAIAFAAEASENFKRFEVAEAAAQYQKIKETLDAAQQKPLDLHDVSVLTIEYALLEDMLRPYYLAIENYDLALTTLKDLLAYYLKQKDEESIKGVLRVIGTVQTKKREAVETLAKAGIQELPPIESIEAIDPLQDFETEPVPEPEALKLEY